MKTHNLRFSLTVCKTSEIGKVFANIRGCFFLQTTCSMFSMAFVAVMPVIRLSRLPCAVFFIHLSSSVFSFSIPLLSYTESWQPPTLPISTMKRMKTKSEKVKRSNAKKQINLNKQREETKAGLVKEMNAIKKRKAKDAKVAVATEEYKELQRENPVVDVKGQSLGPHNPALDDDSDSDQPIF